MRKALMNFGSGQTPVDTGHLRVVAENTLGCDRDLDFPTRFGGRFSRSVNGGGMSWRSESATVPSTNVSGASSLASATLVGVPSGASEEP